MRRADTAPARPGRQLGVLPRRLAGAAAIRAIVWSARIAGLLTIVVVLLPWPRRMFGGPLRSTLGLPPALGLASAVLTLVVGVSTVMLATGLRRRKRRAWTLAVAATATLTVVNVVHAATVGRGLVAAVATAVLLILLVASRRYFVARPDQGGLARGLLVLVQLSVAGAALVFLLLVVNRRRLAGAPGLGELAGHALLSLIGVQGSVTFRAPWLDDLTSAVGLTFGVVALLTTGYFLLRTPEPVPRLDAADGSRVRALLHRGHDGDSLGYFALRRDKAVVFAPGEASAVSYRVLAGVALASGDPLGDPGSWPAAIEAFLAACAGHAWVPAVLACSERGATAWAKAGLDALELGDEAILHTAMFTLDGRPMRGVRQAVARVRRAGYTVEIRRLAEIDAAERAQLAEAAASWRGDAAERGFSMALSRVADAADPQNVLVVARCPGPEGSTIRGVLQFVPWGTDGLSLDLMRRDPDADNGLNEMLIAEVMAAAPGLGVCRVSLNFAVFRAALERGERIGAGPVARLWARLLRLASRWWQIDSLYRFNAKFRPEWAPRFLAFPAVRDLPRIAFAALEAEGFGGRPPAVLRLLGR